MPGELPMSDSFYEKLALIVEANLENEHFGANELVQEVGLSRSQIHRKLKSISGQSVNQFVREIRLRRAHELLEDQVGTASEIAYKVGFNSPTYFNKSFHDYYGYPPGSVKSLDSRQNQGQLKEGALPEVETEAASDLPYVNKAREKKQLPYIVLGAMVIMMLMYFLYEPQVVSQELPQVGAEVTFKSIAVLPFDNFSPKKEENQYLCDGFMEEIINHLSKVRALHVRSRSSVEQYRENRPTSPEIAQKLHATHLLEGSVQRIGDELKVVVQLILAGEDRHIWQESFEEPIEDILQMQSDIAQKVAGQLKIALTLEEQGLIETPPTENLKAYELYLQGKYHAYIWGLNLLKIDYEKTLTLLQRAEREDSTFAWPIARRAKLYWEVWNAGFKNAIVLDSILILANQAITLDPELVSAYLSRAWYFDMNGNFERALMDRKKAFQLNPNNYEANWNLGVQYFRSKKYVHGLQLVHRADRLAVGEHYQFWILHRLGLMYLELGDAKEVFHYWNRMEILEPNSRFVKSIMVWHHQNLKQWDSAYKAIQKLDTLQAGTLAYKNVRLAVLNLDKQEVSKALNHFQKAAAFRDEWSIWDKTLYGMALCLTGRKEEGEKVLNKSLDQYKIIDQSEIIDKEVQIAAIYAFFRK